MCALPVGVFAEDKEISTQILTLSPSAGALGIFVYVGVMLGFCLQCFDAVGWVAGRASGL